jgi:hypothetical protein
LTADLFAERHCYSLPVTSVDSLAPSRQKQHGNTSLQCQVALATACCRLFSTMPADQALQSLQTTAHPPARLIKIQPMFPAVVRCHVVAAGMLPPLFYQRDLPVLGPSDLNPYTPACSTHVLITPQEWLFPTWLESLPRCLLQYRCCVACLLDTARNKGIQHACSQSRCHCNT